MNPWMIAGAVLQGLAPAAWLLWNACRWLEARGWISFGWKDSGGGVSGAFWEIQKLLEPKVQHVIRADHDRRKDKGRGAYGDRPKD